MTRLADAFEAARVAATAPPRASNARDLVLEILRAAAEDQHVRDNLKDVSRGRALLRFTDTDQAIEFSAGGGAGRAAAGGPQGQGARVDEHGAQWVGLTSRPLEPRAAGP